MIESATAPTARRTETRHAPRTAIENENVIARGNAIDETATVRPEIAIVIANEKERGSAIEIVNAPGNATAEGSATLATVSVTTKSVATVAPNRAATVHLCAMSPLPKEDAGADPTRPSVHVAIENHSSVIASPPSPLLPLLDRLQAQPVTRSASAAAPSASAPSSTGLVAPPTPPRVAHPPPQVEQQSQTQQLAGILLWMTARSASRSSVRKSIWRCQRGRGRTGVGRGGARSAAGGIVAIQGGIGLLEGLGTSSLCSERHSFGNQTLFTQPKAGRDFIRSERMCM